jgi:hypothetical protein
MTGMARRLARILVLAGLALAVMTSSGAAASRMRGPIAGVVPHASRLHTPERRAVPAAAGPRDVSLQTKPCKATCWVMHTNTTYAIYWVPSGQSVAPGYESDIDQYLSDVAAVSGSKTNVFSVATQYYDATGHIAYQSTFGGSDVDTDPFPANGCNDQVDSVCLTDQQVQNEIANVIAANGWSAGPDSLFILMTPDGVGSCFDSSGQQCSSNYYCGYHNSFSLAGRPVVYANLPYDATISGGSCSSGSSPNGNDADSTINIISHEQNEAITDPNGNAWINKAGEEIGDLCTWRFGNPRGGNGLDDYNQVINGHHYWLQEEYSNDGSRCRQHYAGLLAPASRRTPSITGRAQVGRKLSAGKGTWSEPPKTYLFQWLRCNAAGGSCVTISGATHASYKLTKHDAGHRLRVRVTAVNSAGRTTATSRPTARVSAAKR